MNVYHSSFRFHGFGAAAAVRIGWATFEAYRAVPDVPAMLWSLKLAPMKSTYQGQAVPWYVSVAEWVPTKPRPFLMKSMSA